MLVTSISFFSHIVLKRLFPPVRQKSSLCGKELIKISNMLKKLSVYGLQLILWIDVYLPSSIMTSIGAKRSHIPCT